MAQAELDPWISSLRIFIFIEKFLRRLIYRWLYGVGGVNKGPEFCQLANW